jgi:Tfp pilus assembly protein PilP
MMGPLPTFFVKRLSLILGFSALLLPWSPRILSAQEPPPYIYQAEGKRDPFQVPHGMVSQQESGVLKDSGEYIPVRVKEYLEKFQLDSLKLVAILFQIEGQKSAAMVQDPEGRGHLVRVGRYIGVNEGRISRISDGEITIVEPTLQQKNKFRTITLRLHKKDGQ